MRSRRIRRFLPLLPALLVLPAVAAPAAAQGDDHRMEIFRLREAAALEWRGRLEEAEEVLVGILGEHPTSTGALFSLERILRKQERVGESLVFADELLVREPRASGVRQMKLRVLAELDSLSALDPVARAWFEAEPGSPDPFREVARLYARELGGDEALTILREGRERLGGGAVLALEMGDLLAELGRPGEAVQEWSRALDRPDADLSGILRRVRSFRGTDAQAVVPLLDALTAPPTSAERRVAAVRVALEMGLAEQARRVAEDARDALPPGERAGFLARVAEAADDAGEARVALWALQAARPLADEPGRPTLDLRIASTALAAGDTAAAVEAQDRLADALPRGSAERRRVLAELIRVEAPVASARTLESRLSDFAADHPDAAELDDLRALVAGELLVRADSAAARRVLQGPLGPRSLAARGYLELTRGQVDAAVTTFQAAVPGLAPTRATGILELVSLLRGVRAPSARVLARSAAARFRGEEGAVDTLVTSLSELPDPDRPGLMRWAARTALEAGDTGRARELYRTLVDGYPDSPEFSDAALALARIHLEAGETGPARTLLETLILEHPGSPVVPAARRALQELRRGQGDAPDSRPDPARP